MCKKIYFPKSVNELKSKCPDVKGLVDHLCSELYGQLQGYEFGNSYSYTNFFDDTNLSTKTAIVGKLTRFLTKQLLDDVYLEENLTEFLGLGYDIESEVETEAEGEAKGETETETDSS